MNKVNQEQKVNRRRKNQGKEIETQVKVEQQNEDLVLLNKYAI